MGQHPHEPSTIMQQVAESGHSNWLPGHWTAPNGLSANRRIQNSMNPVSKGHSQYHHGRNCRSSYRRHTGRSQGLGDLPGSHQLAPTAERQLRHPVKLGWCVKPLQQGLSMFSRTLQNSPWNSASLSVTFSQNSPSVQESGPPRQLGS